MKIPLLPMALLALVLLSCAETWTSGDPQTEAASHDSGVKASDAEVDAPCLKCAVEDCNSEALNDSQDPAAMVVHQSVSGDWTLALDPAFTELREVAFTNRVAVEAAVVFDDPLAGVAGFVLSKVGTQDAMHQDQADEVAMGAINDLSIKSVFNRQPFVTYDQFPATRSQRFVTVQAPLSVGLLRDQLLLSISGHAQADLQIPKGSDDGASNAFMMLLTTIRRDDRIIVIGSVAPETRFAEKSQPASIRMGDLINGTAIARHGRLLKAECVIPPVNSVPAADIVWIVDTSASMFDDQTLIANAASTFFATLGASGIDYRVGVMRAGCKIDGGWLSGDRFTTDETEFSQWMLAPTGPGGCTAEAPATAGRNFYQEILQKEPAASGSQDMSMGLRKNAQLI